MQRARSGNRRRRTGAVVIVVVTFATALGGGTIGGPALASTRPCTQFADLVGETGPLMAPGVAVPENRGLDIAAVTFGATGSGLDDRLTIVIDIPELGSASHYPNGDVYRAGFWANGHFVGFEWGRNSFATGTGAEYANEEVDGRDPSPGSFWGSPRSTVVGRVDGRTVRIEVPFRWIKENIGDVRGRPLTRLWARTDESLALGFTRRQVDVATASSATEFVASRCEGVAS